MRILYWLVLWGLVRLLSPASTAAQARTSLAEVAAEWPSITWGETTVCYINPRGGCLPVYPSLSGTTAVIGLIAKPAGWVEAELGVGAGELSGVGAAVGSGDVAIFPLRRVGLLAGARWIAVPRFRGDRLGVIPWTIGLRLR